MADQLTPSLESSAKEFGLGLRDARGPRNFFSFLVISTDVILRMESSVCVCSRTCTHLPAKRRTGKSNTLRSPQLEMTSDFTLCLLLPGQESGVYDWAVPRGRFYCNPGE